MVAAAPAAASTTANSAAVASQPNPKNPYPQADPTRPPLIPSEKDNAAVSRRPTKRITSRYLSYPSSSSSSSSSSTSTSSSSTNTSSSGGRRYPSPSPLLTPRPSTPPALPHSSSVPRRSHSVGRARPRPDSAPATPAEPPSTAARAISTTTTTTRSLSVSFQGESFFYQTSKAKAASPKTATERRRPTTPVRTTTGKPTTTATPNHSENSRPFECWPAARARQPNPLARSLDCSGDRKEPILATVRLLQHSMVFDDATPRRASFDGGDLSASSDTDSVSSGSNSGVPELTVPLRARTTPRGICVPARFWQETNSRMRRLPDPGSPLSSSTPRKAAPLNMASVKRSLVDCPLSSPRSVSSPLRGPIRPSSPSKLGASPSRGMASPSRARSSALATASPAGQPSNAPSIISFAAEVRRAKKGESRIEEAHMLRIFHNRHLQWRFVNARATAALMAQRMTTEKNLYNAWITTSGLHDSVTIKRIKLQLLTQNIKLTSILKGQMTYLEEWSLMDRDHSSSLSGAIEALKASTLRLPVGGGARADLQELKDAVGSAVDVMQAMGSSICSLLSKVEGTSSLVSELAKVAAHERSLMDQSRDLLSTVAAMHVMQCSLQGHIQQLKRRPSQMQL